MVDEKLTNEINALKLLVDTDLSDNAFFPESSELIPLYEAVFLMKRRYENRIREMKQAASERDAFYDEMQHIRAEHHMAEQIQRSMLPKESELYHDSHGIDIFADMDTAWEVGGDYYDFFPVDKDRFFFCIGDVAGKGISAAIFCSVVKTLIGISVQNGEELSKVCADVSKRLFQTQNSLSKMFVTLWAGIVDSRDGTVRFVNAGHDTPYVIHQDGSIERIESRSGMPIASYYDAKRPERSRYQAHEFRMKKGDTLLLYTDGIIDSEDHKEERYGNERLYKSIQDISGGNYTAKEYITFLERGIDSYADKGERDDDITLLALKYLGIS